MLFLYIVFFIDSFVFVFFFGCIDVIVVGSAFVFVFVVFYCVMNVFVVCCVVEFLGVCLVFCYVSVVVCVCVCVLWLLLM